jgi:RHS repeat-associated protein
LEHLVPNPVGCSLAQFVAGLQDDHARYDGFGNRLSQTVTQGTGPSSVTLVNGNTNRISSAGYAYDSNGNMTQMPKGSGSMTLDYDLSNRVSGVSHPDGAEQYRYAPDNRRVWRSAGRTACYAHRGNDGQFEWVGYGEGTSEQVILYSPGGQKMGAYCVIFSPNLQYSAVTASEENVYYGGRLVGKRLVSVTGSNNGLVSAFTADRLQSKGNGSNYYPYGESKNSTAGDDREGFATYTRDEKSGLDYANQRWYASGVGRFTSPDPYQASAGPSDPGSWNRFTYVRGEPIGRYDPLGLADCVPNQHCEVTVTDQAPGDAPSNNGDRSVLGDGMAVPVSDNPEGAPSSVAAAAPSSDPPSIPNPARSWSAAITNLNSAKIAIMAQSYSSVSDDCKKTLDSLGQNSPSGSRRTGAEMYSAIRFAAANSVFHDISTSQDLYSSLYANTGAHAAVIAKYGPVTIREHYINNPGSHVLAQMFGNNIYLASGAVSTSSLFRNQGLLMHELLHNVGFDDDGLKDVLGITSNQNSSWISYKLSQQCFN